MTLPFALPDWLPWWVPTLLLVPVALYALAFLFMPFSVIGLKSRLETIEARLDEIQGEIRHMTLRMPEQPRAPEYDESYVMPDAPETRRPAAPPPVSRPPIPPAAQSYTPRPVRADALRPAPVPPPTPARPAGRAEPRLDWPR